MYVDPLIFHFINRKMPTGAHPRRRDIGGKQPSRRNNAPHIECHIISIIINIQCKKDRGITMGRKKKTFFFFRFN